MAVALRSRTTDAPGRYAAFLSYSHDGDRDLAVAVQRSLHEFARPWFRVRAVRVFRDEGSLAASSALRGSIEQALLDSTHLILLASPTSAASPWVGREVVFWCRHKPLDRLLIVLTDGDIQWDDAAQDFAWPRTPSLPRALRDRFPGEPRYVDLRWVRGDADRMSLRDARFRVCIADLAAPLHGRPKDTLIGEDVRAHRRVRALVRAAVAALVVVVLALALLTNTAVRERAKAAAGEAAADAARRAATSRQLAAESLVLPRDDLDTALLLGVQALRLADTTEARSALAAALLAAQDVAALIRTEGGVAGAAYAPATDRVAVVDQGAHAGASTLSAWDVKTHRRMWTVPVAESAHLVSFLRAGTRIAVIHADGATIYDAVTGAATGAIRAALRDPIRIALSADGSTLAAADFDTGRVRVWDLALRRLVRTFDLVGFTFVGQLVVSDDGRYAAAVDGPSRVDVWQVATGRRVHTFQTRYEVHGAIAVDSTGTRVAVVRDEPAVEVWDAATGTSLAVSAGIAVPFEARLDLSPDGLVVAVGDRTGQTFWPWASDALVPPGDWLPRRLAVFDATVHVVGTRAGPLYSFADPNAQARLLQPVSVVPVGTARALAADESRSVELDTGTGRVLRKSGTMIDLVADTSGRTLAYFGSTPTGLSGLQLSTDGGVTAKPVPGLPDAVAEMALSADGRVLAARVTGGTKPSATSGTVRLVDVATGRELAVLTGTEGRRMSTPGDIPHSLAVSADGTVVAYATQDGVSVWRAGRTQTLAVVDGASPLALSRDGSLLAVGDRSAVVVVDTASMTRLGRLRTGRAAALAFDAVGRSIAIAGEDGLGVWDTARLERRMPLSRDDLGWTSVAFADGDGTVLAGESTGGVRAWGLDVSKMVATACAAVSRDFDAMETRQYIGRTAAAPHTCVAP
jgi:WD40 repeat protein